MRFRDGEKVRVVTAESPFFGWTGEIVASYPYDFIPGIIQYHIRISDLAAFLPPLLFKEDDLAFAGE